ncbi:methionyl-tRNA formyltransferase [Candidatus Saccharibacteria bacterium]|nr:methionyl-tRNA formyltransferase [Candidatus Saccharibacteria bacterium]
MTHTLPKILFFGTEDFSLHSLQALVEADFKIAAVITKPDSKKGRGHKLTNPAVKQYALSQGIPVWQPQSLDEISNKITSLQPVCGILVSYGKIIPQRILNLFNPGIINVHPSLLPRYRGPSPIESAILHGDMQTGVSIMQLVAKMDAGPIYEQVSYSLNGAETKPQLYHTLGQIGAAKLVSLLPHILSGDLRPIPQDDSKASLCPMLSKSDTPLNPAKFSAYELERKIRAHLGYPKTSYTLPTGEIIILLAATAHITPNISSEQTILDIACSDNTVLSIASLISPHGKKMTREEFLRGYKIL